MIMRLRIAPMIAITVAGLLLAGTPATGTMYVTDVLRLTLRSAPDTGSEILGVIKSGQSLEVISENEAWTQVRLPDGREGWVPGRYLVAERTAELKLNSLQRQFDAQKKELETIRSELAAIKKQNKDLHAGLEQQTQLAQEATKAYNTLKEASADFLELEKEYKSTLEKATEQSAQIIGLENQLTRLETQRLVRWFLAGAGVLLLGFVVGFSAKRQRRKYLA